MARSETITIGELTFDVPAPPRLRAGSNLRPWERKYVAPLEVAVDGDPSLAFSVGPVFEYDSPVAI